MNEQNLEKTMHMTVKWKTQVSFIFESWSVESTLGLITGIIITMAIGILLVALPTIKKKLENLLNHKKQSNELFLQDQQKQSTTKEQSQQATFKTIIGTFCYMMIYSTLHISNMMLVMTYNGFVILAVIGGLSVGYSVFGMEDDQKGAPVNCCC